MHRFFLFLFVPFVLFVVNICKQTFSLFVVVLFKEENVKELTTGGLSALEMALNKAGIEAGNQGGCFTFIAKECEEFSIRINAVNGNIG